MIEIDKIYNEDCLEGMKRIDDASVDCIITDLPYGTTCCAWDSVIPFEPLWEQYRRITKPNAAIVLFGSEPFSSALRMSNIKEYRYDWVWRKPMGVGYLNAKKMPLKVHEIISVFYRQLPTYNPQFTKGEPYRMSNKSNTSIYGKREIIETISDGRRYPVDVLDFNGVNNHPPQNGKANTVHPTQKPVDLIRYLVLTYTDVGGVVLDSCMGSGTTAIACLKERRHFLGFELNKEYFNIAQRRIALERQQPQLDFTEDSL